MAEQLYIRQIREILDSADNSQVQNVALITTYPFEKLAEQGFASLAEAKAASKSKQPRHDLIDVGNGATVRRQPHPRTSTEVRKVFSE